MAQGIERFSAPPPGDDFDPTGEAQFRRLIEQFMENADYRVRDVGDDVESIDTTVTDHESRITTLEGLGRFTVIDSGAATVSASTTTVVTSDPAIGSGSVGVCVVATDDSSLGFIGNDSRFHLHNSAESTSLSMKIALRSSNLSSFAAGVVVLAQHSGTPDHYDLEIEEAGGNPIDVHYLIGEVG